MIQHLACIMDGNRRWAKKQGLLLAGGASEGLNKITLAVDFCLAHKIPYLSLYAFSIENFKRSEYEKNVLFDLLAKNGKKQAEEMAAKNVRVRFIGDRSLFPDHVKAVINESEKKTASCTQLVLNLLFCYGGRQEILAAVNQLIEEKCANGTAASKITEQEFKKYLWLGGIPDPDLIIRTGFMHRLSSFLIYQSAYSELYFADCLWPDITEKNLQEAVAYFDECKRNFGS